MTIHQPSQVTWEPKQIFWFFQVGDPQRNTPNSFDYRVPEPVLKAGDIHPKKSSVAFCE